MVFKPFPCTTRWEGAAASLWIVLLDLLMIVWAARRPADTLKFVLVVLLVASVPLLVHLVYRTWGAFSLEYWVDRNAVTLRWANVRQVIPLQSVRQIAQHVDLPVRRTGLLEWPAPYLRLAPDQEPRFLNLCATRPLADCLVLVTDTGNFALSPSQPDAFLATAQERYALGPTQLVKPERVRHSWLDRVLPGDRLGAWLLGGGLLGVLILFGVLMIAFPDLPDVLTVRYNSAGLPEEIREKSALFRLPMIGLLAWAINGLSGTWLLAQRQRIGAYMLWGGAIVVETFTLLALVVLIT